MVKKVSSGIMLGVLAASVILTPTLNTFALTNDTYLASFQEKLAIIEKGGWLESAFVEWNKVEGATGYNVYYKAANEADSKYKQLDNELIRQYPSYFRADVLGLKAGEYIIKVVPIKNETELSKQAVITEKITVEANAREGFAFSKESPMGTSSGGYNDDGTVPANAQIVYISSDTVNTVTLDVITNSKGSKTTCTGLANILAARQKGYDKTPLIIRMIGEVKGADIKGLNSSGYVQIKGAYNLTFEGVGEDATVNGWGFLVRDSHNIEIRNLGIMLFPDDGLSLDTNNENIWLHNNDIFYGTAGSDADQAKGDGSTDVKAKSTYVTLSYNHYYDSGKSSLCGMNDTEEFFVTYHHNWFDHSDSRHPRIRVGTVHIYNNYFDGNSKYGVGVTKGSSAFVEANYYRNCKYPMLTSLQGSDIYGGSKGTFSGEAGGMIKAYNNIIEGASRIVFANENSKQIDAYLAATRDEKVASSYKTVSGGNTYNNFDTKDTMYSYAPDDPSDVKDVVTTYAGRVNGGDFNWEFTEADDTSYTINTELMAKLKSYKSALVSIGGKSVVVSGGEEGETPEVPEVPEETPEVPEVPETPNVPEEDDSETDNDGVAAEIAHNFTTQDKVSEFFTIKGDLSTIKGTVSYNGLSLTQCLKIDSAASVEFTTETKQILTLVFNSTFSKNILIDGVKYKAVKGIVEVELEAGKHIIKKSDTCNLYYINLK